MPRYTRAFASCPAKHLRAKGANVLRNPKQSRVSLKILERWRTIDERNTKCSGAPTKRNKCVRQNGQLFETFVAFTWEEGSQKSSLTFVTECFF